MAAATPKTAGTRSFDLRERKRTRTRLMIQTEAMRLFAQQGYAETTVEQIADAAAISPRTFFRYFPTKEDVVLWDEYDPLAGELLEARPQDEPPARSMRMLMRTTLEGLHQRDPEQLLTRVRLIGSVPDLRARFLENQLSAGEEIAQQFAPTRGLAADDLGIAVTAAALIAAVGVALDRWQRTDGKADLLQLLNEAIDALAKTAADLQAN
jgi:AcrR family transcriptional regulator